VVLEKFQICIIWHCVSQARIQAEASIQVINMEEYMTTTIGPCIGRFVFRLPFDDS
jgi:hypothetical protein